MIKLITFLLNVTMNADVCVVLLSIHKDLRKLKEWILDVYPNKPPTFKEDKQENFRYVLCVIWIKWKNFLKRKNKLIYMFLI
jgi:hypothetical protein